MKTPNYEAPDCRTVDAALKAIDTLLNECGLEAMDNTCAGLVHYVHARWDAFRAEREVYGEAWCAQRYEEREVWHE